MVAADTDEGRPSKRRLTLLPDDRIALDLRASRLTVRELAMLRFTERGRLMRVREVAEWLERKYESPHGGRIADGRKAVQRLYQHGVVRLAGLSEASGREDK